MATELAAELTINARTTLYGSDPITEGTAGDRLSTRRWTQGIASGNVDRRYLVDGTLAGSATDSYNLLAAGSLTDDYGQAIDADELKGLVLKCVTGQITFLAPGANQLGCFNAAADGIILAAGQTMALDFGAGGLDVTVNSLFDVDDSGGAGSTYELWLIVAQ